MQTLSDQEFLELNSSGLKPDQLSVKKLTYSGVELEFHQQPPGRMIELMLSVGEAMKSSSAINRIVENYFPQLKGRFEELNSIAALEILMLAIKESAPGGLDLKNLVDLNSI